MLIVLDTFKCIGPAPGFGAMNKRMNKRMNKENE
jgi:hypothetical protein